MTLNFLLVERNGNSDMDYNVNFFPLPVVYGAKICILFYALFLPFFRI